MDIEITCNTDDAVLFNNIEQNSKLPLEWVKYEEAHEEHAVIVGGGYSLSECLDKIKWRKSLGQKVFALNNSAKYLLENGIVPDYQVIMDARPQNVEFVNPDLPIYLNSQCDTSLFAKTDKAILWHSVIDGIESHIKSDKEYALVGGGLTVGLSAMCLVYALGYRKIHIFGYDSSYHEGKSHAYEQELNKGEQLCEVSVNGKVFTASLTMGRQAELFQQVAHNLIDAGCVITVDGHGAIPEIAKLSMLPQEVISEEEKYRRMWSIDAYRENSPGERTASLFALQFNPQGTVIDFGCGSGRGGAKIEKLRGSKCKVILADFADNCVNKDIKLPFVHCDLTKSTELKGDYGYCTDVMEHIPTEDVETVIKNIMNAVPKCFFQICLVNDSFGGLIGHPLHLSVFPSVWWYEKFKKLGFKVEWMEANAVEAQFFITL